MLGGGRKADDLDFMPDAIAAAKRGGARGAYVLSLLVVAFVFGFAFWADRAELEEVTRGEGRVIPSGRVQVIQHLEGGILADLAVNEGDVVDKGAILVRIDNTVAGSSYRETRSHYLGLLAEITRLEAEIEEREPVFPDAVRTDAKEMMADQLGFLAARRQELAAKLAVQQSQVEQRNQEIDEIKSREAQLSRSLALAREERAITEPLVRQGVMSRVNLLRLDRDVNDLAGELKTLRLARQRAATALRQSRQRLTEISLTAKSASATDLIQRRAELEGIEEQLVAGESRFTRTEIRSPARGIVKDLKVTTIGGVVRPGEDIMEIVPVDDRLLIEADIRPQDIAFLQPGLPAVIKISAYDFSVYKGMKARLVRISADTIENDMGERFYRAVLEVDDPVLRHKDEDLPIIPGMTATAEIITGKKTVLDYLLSPVLTARNQALRER
jgi:adhesin transport system membrane fusion protein